MEERLSGKLIGGTISPSFYENFNVILKGVTSVPFEDKPNLMLENNVKEFIKQ